MRSVSRTLKPLSFGGFGQGRGRAQACVLTYHGIAGRSCFNCVSTELFERQLDWLRIHYRVVPLGDLVADLARNDEQQSDVAAITFDDGYANFSEFALPVLEKYALHATVFVPSAKVGSYNDWDEGSENYVRMPLLGWEELRALPEKTVEVGSHGRTHRRLDTISLAEAELEVRGSRTDLEEGIGRPVTLFAYPHGACPPGWCDRKGESPAKHYRAVCTTRWGRFNSAETVHAMRRIGVWDSDSFEDFVDKMSGCYDWLAFKEGVGRFLRKAKRSGGGRGSS